MSEMANKKRSSNKSSGDITAILDQDTNNLLEEDVSGKGTGGWKQDMCKYLQFVMTGDCGLLNSTNNDTIDLNKIRKNLSAEIVKDNVLEMTSESELIDVKKKKIALVLENRESKSNNFLSALNNTGDRTSLNTLERHSDYSENHSKRISPAKLQEDKEDSEDSISNVPLKLKVKNLKRKVHEDISNQNIFLDELTSESITGRITGTSKTLEKLQADKEDSEDSISNVPLKLRVKNLKRKIHKEISNQNIFLDELISESITDHVTGTSEAHPVLRSEASNKSHPDNMNSSISNSLKAQRLMTNRSSVPDVSETARNSDCDSEDVNSIVKRKSKVLRRLFDNEEKNDFEDAFTKSLHLRRASRDFTRKIDNDNVEPGLPKILSHASSETSADNSESDVANNRTRTSLVTSTSPRAKFFKALSSGKKTQDTIQQQESLNSPSSDTDTTLSKKSVALKPKTAIIKRIFNKSLTNPFEGILQQTSDSSIGSDRISPTRDSTIPESNVFMRSASQNSKDLRSMRSKRSVSEQFPAIRKNDSRDASHRRSPSIDSEEEINVSVEVHEHPEKQLTEVSNAADVPSSVLQKSRTVVSLEERFSSRNKFMEDDTPKISEGNTPEISEGNTPEISEGNTPEISEGDTPEISEDDTPANKTPLIAKPGVNEVKQPAAAADDLFGKTTRKSEPSIPIKRVSEPSKKVHKTRNSLRSQSVTPKIAKDVATKLPKRSTRLNSSAEHFENVIPDAEIEMHNTPRTRRSTRNSRNIPADKRASAVVDESTGLDEVVVADDEDAAPAAQTSPQNSSSSKDQTGNRMTTRQTSARLSISQHEDGETNVNKNKDTSRRQSSLTRSQSQQSTSIKTSSKDNKTNAPNKTIDDFFRAKRSLTDKKQATSNDQLSSEIFKDAEKMQQIKEQLETMKNREMAAMKMQADKSGKKRLASKTIGVASGKTVKRMKPFVNPAKKVDKAYLVNGKVYKPPRLPRPKQWVTDRLYNFLWKRMEPKYNMSTRVRSEKFIEEFSKIVTLITRRTKYDSYKAELEALMKEMARLQIISTRKDFYDFCRDFMPYDFRVKVIPILLPGNRKTIPYDPGKLNTLLLDE